MPDSDYLDDWASEECGAAKPGDPCLTQLLVSLARRLSLSPQCSFSQPLQGPELKGSLFRQLASRRQLLSGFAFDQTLSLMQQVPVVLPARVTTDFHPSRLPATEGLGYCSRNSARNTSASNELSAGGRASSGSKGSEHLDAPMAHRPNTRIVGVSDREGDVYDVVGARATRRRRIAGSRVLEPQHLPF